MFSKTIDSADSAILQVDDSGIDLKRLCAAIATFEEASKRERTNPAIFSDLLQISTSFLSNYVCMISICIFCILRLEQRHAFTRDVNFTTGQKSELFDQEALQTPALNEDVKAAQVRSFLLVALSILKQS